MHSRSASVSPKPNQDSIPLGFRAPRRPPRTRSQLLQEFYVPAKFVGSIRAGLKVGNNLLDAAPQGVPSVSRVQFWSCASHRYNVVTDTCVCSCVLFFEIATGILILIARKQGRRRAYALGKNPLQLFEVPEVTFSAMNVILAVRARRAGAMYGAQRKQINANVYIYERYCCVDDVCPLLTG